MPLVSTPAVVLSTIRYGETSKIVRLATRDYGVQSVIAKGALRPRSRFGAAMQLLSLGQAHIIISERRDLQILTAFDLQRLHVALARDMDRYAAASALAEVTMRFAPADPHPEIYQFLHLALAQLEEALLRDCRYVVGIKLHTQGMTVEDGAKMFVDRCFQEPANGRSVERRPPTGGAAEVHEAGCVTASPEPLPDPAPSTEIVR